MTKDQWPKCKNPQSMLRYLHANPEEYWSDYASERKLRLLACAIARMMENSSPHPERTAVIEACELMADDRISAWGKGRIGLVGARNSIELVWGWTWAATHERVGLALTETIHLMQGNAGCFYRQEEVCNLIRQIFGNPFLSALTKSLWGVPILTNDITSLAEAAYDHRWPDDSGLIQCQRLAVLSDALEEAGCTDNEILSNLRSAGPHYRGCWYLDIVLGRE